MNLSRENFLKARDHIFAGGDNITKAWFRYNFEGEDTDAFLEVLAGYQHENGGFGGLVHEFNYQGPCLKCTEHAFRYLFYLKERPSAEHPMIQKMMSYLLERYLPGRGCWGELLEPGVNDFPHVPWWTYPDGDTSPIPDPDEQVSRYNANGEASFAAMAACWHELIPEELYRSIIRCPSEHILRYYDENSPLFGKSARLDHGKNDIESPYNLKCYQMFVKCLPDKELAGKLAAILRQNPTACMQLDYAAWENGYEELPCDVVETPDSVVYPAVKKIVDDSLDYLIRRQSEDGCWHLTWSFGDDPCYRSMEKLYDAHYTGLMLAKLKRFGRIDL